jgi:glycosyltransferase involved in cell wall biosynthesis
MKLIVIDPHVTARSPSMRAWVGAFPGIRDLFESVEVWAGECDLPEGDGVVWKRFLQRLPTWTLHARDYQRRVLAMARGLPSGGRHLVQVTGCVVPAADIRYIHYWNSALLEEHAARRETFPLPVTKKLPALLAARDEKAAVKSAKAADNWWVVSRSLAEKIKASGAAGHFEVLPNQYDPARFNPAVRTEWRDRMRADYGFQPDEKILVFSAFGHFERKGLHQAAEAVRLLRNKGHAVRLLVLGGTPATVERFRGSLAPEQRDGLVFAGLVDGIERHLAAADGLLFPSHFEAFSLAEIEAAALGLRLYLTPHYGSEMILRGPDNGRLLPWDAAGMAEVIAEDITSGILGETHRIMAEALTPEAYGKRLRALYQDAIRRTEDPRSSFQSPF